ncbi:MAG TPA: cupin domain-containing protein [Candidatus Paceibacterota bacterium]|nr:cupin domain-containing protein [Verrucomicrobiota bacterium]HOX02226.1 cupin domain-containing protein [Verrucomicrobiota bacterium]HRZ45033.1 cupin domain-containing protein [Candidatus Paceibacterota bacterium]HRZ92660.1 cupin domain-containing protein [Candidatus Paceibacterota bacterium]
MTEKKTKKEPSAIPPARQPSAVADLVAYQDGSVVSREILRKTTGTVTLFAFDAGQGLSEHAAPFDALVVAVEGEVEIRLAGQPHRVKAGELLLLPARVPHALSALTRFKMMLIMIRAG